MGSSALLPPERILRARVPAVEAVRRHWLIAILPVIVLVGAGIGLAFQREPVYTAQTTMTITSVDVSRPGALGGFATAAPALATTYSRAVDADAVVRPVAAGLGISSAAVRLRTSATPVPQSPLFRVDANGPSASAAVDLANRTAAALEPYVRTLSSPGASTSRIYDDYRRASSAYEEALADARQAAGDYVDDPTASNRHELAQARAEADATRLRRDTITLTYQRNAEGLGSIPEVRELARATSASSDRMSKVQLYGFGGLVAGVLAGAALATLRANRRVRHGALD